jgi:phage gp36-like protein
MPYLTKAELETHIDIEIIDAITGITSPATDATADNHIDAAISEAKSYLSRFNLDELFHATAPTPADKNLKNKVKDIAVWNIIKKANPNVDMNVMKDNYETSIAWLKDCAKGLADPDGWNLKTDDTDTNMAEGKLVGSSSNTKRINHF